MKKHIWKRYHSKTNKRVSLFMTFAYAVLWVVIGTVFIFGTTVNARDRIASLPPELNSPPSIDTPTLNTATLKPRIIVPAYIYKAKLTKVYDGDTWYADVDLGFNTWRHNEALRLYALNAPEIKRSKNNSWQSVQRGFECRDMMLALLGLDPAHFPHKAKSMEIYPPVEVIIETIKDKEGKYGRMLAIIHKDGVNLNEKLAQTGCAKVELYDGKTRAQTAAIWPGMK